MRQPYIINAQSLNNIIQQLDVGKAAGPDGLPAEALQLGGPKIGYLLALVFNCCFVHVFLKDQLMDVLMIPVVKNKCGNMLQTRITRDLSL